MKIKKVGGVVERQIYSSELLNGWACSSPLTLIREGIHCSLVVPYRSLNGSARTSPVFLALPAGWRPYSLLNYGAIGFLNFDGSPVRLGKDFNSLSCSSSGAGIDGVVTWVTREALSLSLSLSLSLKNLFRRLLCA